MQWSLEHIHAQNSESLKTKDQWKKWFEESLEVVNKIDIAEGDKDKIIKGINSFIDILNKDETKLDDLKDKFDKLFISIVILFQDKNMNTVHELSNMALLDKDTNSSLNNALFPLKRKRIKEKIAKGVFIPICTQRVFTKYYSNNVSQMYFWGLKDRKAYLENINIVLTDFVQSINK